MELLHPLKFSGIVLILMAFNHLQGFHKESPCPLTSLFFAWKDYKKACCFYGVGMLIIKKFIMSPGKNSSKKRKRRLGLN